MTPSSKPRQPDKSTRFGNSVIRPLAVASCGAEFVAAVGLFSFSGLWLDQKLGWLPFLTLTGFAIGLSLGFLSLYKTVYRMQQAEALETAQNAAQNAGRSPNRGKTRMRFSGLEDPAPDKTPNPPDEDTLS